MLPRLPFLAALALAMAAAAAAPVAAQSRQQGAGPKRLGTHQDWTAAVHNAGGQKICYAFTRAERTDPSRQNVMLVVTHRPQGRDQVALRPGYQYPRNAEVTVEVGQTELPFYAAADSAFARDNRAAVAAFRAGAQATSRGPGAGGRGTATDSFSLSGFTAAYEAISRECPEGNRR